MNKREDLEAEFTRLLNESVLENERLNKMLPPIGKLFVPTDDIEKKMEEYDKQMDKINNINKRKWEIVVESSKLAKTK